MNELEKRSFYSFLGLYIVSSLIFITLIGYWYYSAQKHSLESEMHYKLEHIADKTAGEIIMAHMHGTSLKKVELPSDIELALIDTRGEVVEGSLLGSVQEMEPGYYSRNGYNILVSDAPREHMNIAYVVVQSNTLKTELETLKDTVLFVAGLASLIMMVIAWMLSKLFMKPVRERVVQIERFLNDVTHELNTPITSLSMSTDQAMKRGECTLKTLKNISISTKQLYDIYRSLTFLNFSSQKEIAEVIDLKEVLERSVEYYSGLAEIKRIGFDVELKETLFAIPEAQASLLFGNLIGNAVKYSSPGSKIEISLKKNLFRIKDQGIGIAPEQQKEIFKKFKRGTGYSGGFGIGLHIVKRICDEYGIGIELDSVEGEGTEFRLKF